MKPNFSTVIVSVAVITQFGIGCSTWYAYFVMGNLWHELLNGRQLPELSAIAFYLLRWVPFVFASALLIGNNISFLQKRIFQWMSVVLIVEVLVIACMFYGIILPAATIVVNLKK